MSAITAGTGDVYAIFKDEFVMNKYSGLCGKETPWYGRVILACFGLICGVPATLGRFVYVFAFKSRTKTFTETTNDNAVELFCREPDAMAVKSIIIRHNKLITDRAITAISRCFYITKLDLSGCSELSCGLCVRVYVRVRARARMCVCVCVCVNLMNRNP